MGRKAGKSTTGWRQRYLVTVYERRQLFDVVLMRGRMRKADNGTLTALVSVDRHKGWARKEVAGIYSLARARTYEAAQRPEMIGYIAALRMQGYTAINEVPSW
jgi:hypothetical protein